MRLTAKQNRFAELVALGKTQSDAYREAYPNSKNYKDKTVWVKASALMKNGKVKARLKTLQKKTEKKYEVTRDSLVKEIFKAQRMGVIKKNGTAFLKAIELKAKITGNMIERKEVDQKIQIKINYVNK